jgi:hypothetical protein
MVHAHFNAKNWVIFDSIVPQQPSLRVEVTEAENARRRPHAKDERVNENAPALGGGK